MFRIPIAGLAAGVVCATTLCQLVGSSCNFPLLRAGCWAALLDLGWLTFVAVVCARLCRLFHLRGVLAVRTISYFVLLECEQHSSCFWGHRLRCGLWRSVARACSWAPTCHAGPIVMWWRGVVACATILV